MVDSLSGLEPIGEGLVQAFYLIVSLDPTIIDITLRSLLITFSAVIIGSLISLPLGALISFNDFPGKKTVINLIQTLYAIPTVVVGLVVFMFLRRIGPFGFLDLLFTPGGMIIGQTILVLPIITGLTISALSGLDTTIRDTIISLGATSLQFFLSVMKEVRFAIFAAIALAFGRAISEVGAAIIIGGNIQTGTFWGSTRILTTAITLETGKGDIALSIALGIILLCIALIVNSLMTIVQQR
ncbi:ABC transporter permease [Methanofollis fontis]|uniref:ABC transporter permease n=1 Tax=Methanofollis fontis TaxID=2052832 RepID=A0A483CR74_9EURY|nr:ABC transporter permease [Methanofollis fontis]TAJ43569.1 ABC transporter permease [Methanofollis fontis]